MKITKRQLKQIIKEELTKVLRERDDSDIALEETIVDWFKEHGDEYGYVLDAIFAASPETDETGFYEDLNEFFGDKDIQPALKHARDKGLLNDWGGRGFELHSSEPEMPEDPEYWKEEGY